MVCIYCGGQTNVTNSRLQKRSNAVWRRRRCNACAAIFTSIEHIAYENSLSVQYKTSHIMPFERDILFLSIYDACRHRKSAVADATALTETILQKLLPTKATGGIVMRDDIVLAASETLARFDTAAHVQYLAFHPL